MTKFLGHRTTILLSNGRCFDYTGDRSIINSLRLNLNTIKNVLEGEPSEKQVTDFVGTVTDIVNILDGLIGKYEIIIKESPERATGVIQPELKKCNNHPNPVYVCDAWE